MTSALLPQWLVILSLVLPWVPAVVALGAWVKKAVSGNAKKAVWEGPVLAISLTTGILSMQMNLESAERARLHRQLERLTERRDDAGITLFQGPPQAAPEAIKRDIILGYEEKLQNVTLMRFHPSAVPGGGSESSDLIVDEVFRQLGFPLVYIVGCPAADRSAVESGAELARRKAMQMYLFRLLTSEVWDSPNFIGLRRQFMVHVVPEYRASDYWIIRTGKRQLAWQLHFDKMPDGSVGSRLQPPRSPRAATVITSPVLAESIELEVGFFLGKATEALRRQMHLPDYDRAPHTVFAAVSAEEGLRPLRLSEVRMRLAQREKSWQLATAGSDHTVPLPPELQELKEIVSQLDAPL